MNWTNDKGFFLSILLVGICLGFLMGSLVTGAKRPERLPSELEVARSVSGRDDVRLIGFLCGNSSATVLAAEEDEFPDGCKEIRVLRADQSFVTPER